MKNLNLKKLIKKSIILGLTTLTTLSSCGVGTLSAFTPDINVGRGYKIQNDSESKMVDYFNSRRAEHGIAPLQIRHDFAKAEQENAFQLAHSDHDYNSRGQVFDDGKYSWQFGYTVIWAGFDRNVPAFRSDFTRFNKQAGLTYLHEAYNLYHEINNVSAPNAHTITILNQDMKYISCNDDKYSVSCILFKDSYNKTQKQTPVKTYTQTPIHIVKKETKTTITPQQFHIALGEHLSTKTTKYLEDGKVVKTIKETINQK